MDGLIFLVILAYALKFIAKNAKGQTGGKKGQPQRADGRSSRLGREADIERQRQLKSDLKRKWESQMQSWEKPLTQDEDGKTVTASAPASSQKYYEPAGENPTQSVNAQEPRERTGVSTAASMKPRVGGSMVFDSTEGEGYIDGDYRFEEITPHSDDHVVKPFTETAHVHTESSIMGVAPCPPDKKDGYGLISAAGGDAGPDLRRAVIWSEILGKPRSLRQR